MGVREVFWNGEKRRYRILKKVMYDVKYSHVAQEYRGAVDALQRHFQSFIPEQQKVVSTYQKAFTQLHEAMLEIALKRWIL